MKDADERFRGTVMSVIDKARGDGKPPLMIYKALHDKANALPPASGLPILTAFLGASVPTPSMAGQGWIRPATPMPPPG